MYAIMSPETPLEKRRLCFPPRKRRAVAVGALLGQAARREMLLLAREPRGCFRVVGQQEPDERGRDDGWETLEEEKPSPARQAPRLVHVSHAVRDGSAKGTRESGRCEDGGHPDGSLLGPVPEREIVDEAREESWETLARNGRGPWFPI